MVLSKNFESHNRLAPLCTVRKCILPDRGCAGLCRTVWRFAGKHLFCRKMIHKVIGKSSKLFFLRYIDIKLFIVQPVIGIDTDIALFVGINDKGIRRIFVPVCFQDFRTAVADRLTAAGKIGNCRQYDNRVCRSIPSDDKVAYFCLLPWTKP